VQLALTLTPWWASGVRVSWEGLPWGGAGVRGT
jgi:hypothetical protein